MKHSGTADLLTLVGFGVLVVALFKANGRKVFVAVSAGTALVILAGAALVGHAG